MPLTDVRQSSQAGVFPGIPVVSRKKKLNHTEAVQPNTNVFTSCDVFRTLFASSCSQDCIGTMQVQPDLYLLSHGAGTADDSKQPTA